MKVSIDIRLSSISGFNGRKTFGRCLCGVAYEIRSLRRNILDVSTSSRKRSEQFIEEGEGQ
jgi:hypothetical protein